MTDRNLDVALRIRADLGQAKAEVKDFNSELDKTGDAGKTAASGLDAAAESADQQSARLKAMVQSSLAYQQQLTAQMQTEQAAADAAKTRGDQTSQQADAARKINQAAFDSQAAISAQIRSIGELEARLEGSASSFEHLAETERMVDQLMASGLMTNEEYAKALQALDRQEAQLQATHAKESAEVERLANSYDKATGKLRQLAQDEQRLTKAVDTGQISRERYNRAMVDISTQRSYWQKIADDATKAGDAVSGVTLKAGEMGRSLASAARNLAVGNTSGAGNSLLTLGLRGGAGFGAAAAGLAAVALSLGLVATAAYQGYQETHNFELATISTGHVAGETAGQLSDMANKVGDATGKYGKADDAMLKLAQSGKITGDTLQTAAQAAVDLSTLTGDSIEQTTDKIIKLADSPSAMLIKLNEDYHFLTVEVLEHVESLEKQGRAEDAVKVAVEELAKVHAARVKEMTDNAGFLERAWVGVKTTIASVWNDLKDIGRKDAEYQLKAAESTLASLRANRTDRAGWSPFAEQQAEQAVAAAKARVAAEQQAAQAASAATAKRDKDIKDHEDKKKKAEKETADAKRAWDSRETGDLSKKQKLEEKINDIRKEGALLGKSQAEIDTQVSRARARYAESLPKPKKPQKTDAQREEESAKRELDNLTKQVALTGELAEGEKKVSNETRIRYETKQGAYKLASAATKAALIDKAKQLDQAQKEIEAEKKRKEAFDKAERAYESLRSELATPAEAAVEDVIDRVKVLNDALAQGVKISGGYEAALSRIFSDAYTKAPDLRLGGYDQNDLTGLIGDQSQLDAANQKLRAWYSERLQIAEQGRAADSANSAKWDAYELRARQDYAARVAGIQAAQQQLQINAAQSIFDSLTSIAKNAAGEQSQVYRVLFAISKGFAVAQAAVSLATNVAKASEVGFPYNLPFIAGAFAQGAQIVSILSGANYQPATGYATGGRITGPGTGTSDSVPIMASNGEHMIREQSASQPGAREFLDAFNARGMDALWDWTRGYAIGGEIGGGAIYAPAEPRSRPTDARVSGASGVQNRLRVYMYQDMDELAAALAQHPTMEKMVVVKAGENGQAIRADWTTS